MPTNVHEMVIEMFRHRPELAADLLTGTFDVAVPDHGRADLAASDFTDVVPTEYRADAVVVFTATGSGQSGRSGRSGRSRQSGQSGQAGAAVLAVVMEVQRARDPVKRWTWPVYVASLRARLRCPTVLIVVCDDPSVATWCAAPIHLGHPGSTLVPLVLGPGRVPVMTDGGQARRSPELAVLSALMHGANSAERERALTSLLDAVDTLDPDHASLYYDTVLAELPEAARTYLESLMTTKPREYQSEFVRKFIMQGRAEGRAEGVAGGRAEGRAASVLDILDTRGIIVPGEARARITGCADLDQITVWIRRAVTASTIDDLFA